MANKESVMLANKMLLRINSYYGNSIISKYAFSNELCTP